MKVTTITLIQSILALLIVFSNAIFQTKALLSLNRATTTNSDLDQAKKLLLISVLTQFIASIILIVITILIIVYWKQYQTHMSKAVYFSLVMGILLMLTGGSLGAVAAFKMQCYRTDLNVNSAWKQSILTILFGLSGTMITLIIHAFIRREDIKGYVRTALTTKKITVPTYVRVEEKPIVEKVVTKPIVEVQEATKPTVEVQEATKPITLVSQGRSRRGSVISSNPVFRSSRTQYSSYQPQ
jgi:hypothetical protein